MPTRHRLRLFFALVSLQISSVFTEQLQTCEEFESHQDRSGQLDVLIGHSIVLSEIKEVVLLENDDPAHQNFLLQRSEERSKLLSQENKVSKFYGRSVTTECESCCSQIKGE